jgi:hypothetical protein
MMPWDPRVAIAEGNLQSMPGSHGVCVPVCLCVLGVRCVFYQEESERGERQEKEGKRAVCV